jgi:predicted Mrr-cat superfamily restriction endonuclease
VGLLDPDLEWEEFREVVHQAYYATEETYHRSGRAAGELWRFIRDMRPGDLVVVPYGSDFHIAEIAGAAYFDDARVDSDTAHRRPVRWMTAGRAIPRSQARAALQARMKIYNTSADASDLLSDIAEFVQRSDQPGAAPTFSSDLRARLHREVLDELRSGRLDPFGFERVVADLLLALGALECRIIPRAHDVGVDIVAQYRVAQLFKITVAVQAKHYQPTPPVGADVVEYLASGMDSEDANVGMVITTGTFSDAAVLACREMFAERGYRIQLVDGDQLAGLLLEHGLVHVLKMSH